MSNNYLEISLEEVQGIRSRKIITLVQGLDLLKIEINGTILLLIIISRKGKTLLGVTNFDMRVSLLHGDAVDQANNNDITRDGVFIEKEKPFEIYSKKGCVLLTKLKNEKKKAYRKEKESGLLNERSKGAGSVLVGEPALQDQRKTDWTYPGFTFFRS